MGFATHLQLLPPRRLRLAALVRGGGLQVPNTVLAQKKNKYRRDDKGHRCWSGDVLKCSTNHLVAGMIWRKVCGRSSILGGGMFWSWCEPHTFHQVSIILLILFFKSFWCKIANAARNWINSVPQAAVTTFAFSSVFILLLWVLATSDKEVVDNKMRVFAFLPRVQFKLEVIIGTTFCQVPKGNGRVTLLHCDTGIFYIFIIYTDLRSLAFFGSAPTLTPGF